MGLAELQSIRKARILQGLPGLRPVRRMHMQIGWLSYNHGFSILALWLQDESLRMSHEQRLIDRLTSYWTLLRKDAPLPEFVQFNISAIEDVWSQCVLFTVQPTAAGQNPNVNFYNVGDKVKALYGDVAGRSVNTGQRNFQGAAIVRRMGEVIASPQPVYDSGQFVNERSKVVKYRSCLLPFGNRDGKVTHVVAGLSWREF